VCNLLCFKIDHSSPLEWCTNMRLCSSISYLYQLRLTPKCAFSYLRHSSSSVTSCITMRLFAKSSRSPTGKLPSPRRPHSYRIFRSWQWELSSVLLASGLLVAIAVLLKTNDGKPTPDWGTRLNFNALLAFLSTILRAMLVFIVFQVGVICTN
jgi:hypothetical protein